MEIIDDENVELTEEQIKYISDRLNKLSDDLNKEIEKEELYLKSLNLGVQTFLQVNNDNLTIGYTNIEKDWRIVVRLYENKEVKGAYKEWIMTHAPRGLRLHCYKKLPELRKHIIKHAMSLSDKIEKLLSEKEK